MIDADRESKAAEYLRFSISAWRHKSVNEVINKTVWDCSQNGYALIFVGSFFSIKEIFLCMGLNNFYPIVR